ncbi:MAG: hypothetical protein WB816_16360 [Methylocystis sp.]
MTQVGMLRILAAIAVGVVFAVSGSTHALARDNSLIQTVASSGGGDSCTRYEETEKMKCFDCLEKEWTNSGWQWVNTCRK